MFTQNAIGGHTVTYGGSPVTVALVAGASTTVELHPVGVGYVVRYPGADGRPLHVRSYGAVGDGVTDDTAAFVAASVAAVAAGVDYVEAGPGTYHCPGMDSDDMSGVYIVGPALFTPTTYVAAFSASQWARRGRAATGSGGRIAFVCDGGADADTWTKLWPWTRRMGIPLGLAWPTRWVRPWVKELHRHGWELIAHGTDHEDFTAYTTAEQIHEVAQEMVASIAAITGRSDNIAFVYPVHLRNALTDQILSQYFTNGRGVESPGIEPVGAPHKWVTKSRIIDAHMTGGVVSNEIKGELDAIAKNSGRATYYFHYIDDTFMSGLQDMLDYARSLGIEVVRPSELYGSVVASPSWWRSAHNTITSGWTLSSDRSYRPGGQSMKLVPNPTGGGNATGTAYGPLFPVSSSAGMFSLYRVSFRYWLASNLTISANQGLYLAATYYTRALNSPLDVLTASQAKRFGTKFPESGSVIPATDGQWVRVSRMLALGPDVTAARIWIYLTHVAEGQEVNPLYVDDIKCDIIDHAPTLLYTGTLAGTTPGLVITTAVPECNRYAITVTPTAATAGRLHAVALAGTTSQRITVYSSEAADTTQAVQVVVHAGYSWSDMTLAADGA